MPQRRRRQTRQPRSTPTRNIGGAQYYTSPRGAGGGLMGATQAVINAGMRAVRSTPRPNHPRSTRRR